MRLEDMWRRTMVNAGLRNRGGHSQGLHVGVFVHVPHLDGAVVGTAVEIVASRPEGQSLQAKEIWYKSHGEPWSILHSHKDQWCSKMNKYIGRNILKDDDSLPRQHLCGLWVYIVVYTCLAPKWWLLCSCLHWPETEWVAIQIEGGIWAVGTDESRWHNYFVSVVSCLSSHGRSTHQVLSIRGDGHAQDLRGVASVTGLCPFPSTLYCVQLLSSLYIPW